MSDRLLLVFVRTPALGRVKTRLARTLGDEKALRIYERLLERTHATAAPVQATKWVCYADEMPQEDIWSQGGFIRHQQPDVPDLGFRMQTMFAQGLIEGLSPVLIIGSDCPGLDTPLIEEAFQKLESHDLVLGPAQDGGYYLLGLNYLVPDLFKDILWSSDQVLASTLAAAEKLNLQVALLPVLSDVDEEADLQHWPDLMEQTR